jgi:hypothetical protein
LEFKDHFIIKPSFPWWDKNWHAEKNGKAAMEGFYYGSDNNSEWLSNEQLAVMIRSLDLPEATKWAEEQDLL